MKQYINSVIKAFSILEQFSTDEYEISISELSKRLGIPLGTMHRLLLTMEKMGYIKQNHNNDKYQLGLMPTIISRNVRTKKVIKDISYAKLLSLSDKYQEAVHLAVIHRHSILLVDEIVPETRSFNITMNFKRQLYFHASSLGKCLIAFADKQMQEDILSNINLIRFTGNTITNKDEFIHELEEIRKQGYAVDNQELEEGLVCVSAPIFDNHHHCIASISLSILNHRLHMDPSKIANDIIATAKEISDSIGCRESLDENVEGREF